jgi:hypothetical protein
MKKIFPHTELQRKNSFKGWNNESKRQQTHPSRLNNFQNIFINHYATSWKVAGSRPDEANEYFEFT